MVATFLDHLLLKQQPQRPQQTAKKKSVYYINNNEILGELSWENVISSHVKISPLLWLDNKSRLSHQNTIKVKWFGSSLVFT